MISETLDHFSLKCILCLTLRVEGLVDTRATCLQHFLISNRQYAAQSALKKQLESEIKVCARLRSIQCNMSMVVSILCEFRNKMHLNA